MTQHGFSASIRSDVQNVALTHDELEMLASVMTDAGDVAAMLGVKMPPLHNVLRIKMLAAHASICPDASEASRRSALTFLHEINEGA